MHGVGPSTVLGGRYAVQRRLEQLPRAERWSAHDLTLERDVVVVCFEEHESHAPAVLDAARRVAGLDNHRLVRVLDVGRSEGIAFFVEEALHDAQTLAHILEQGGLPAEEVRRIAGESATGLEAARARGLHHLVLTPSAVLRGSDGTIKVRGVATAAALEGVDDVDSVQASRTDAVGVVAVAYAALTSRWPLPGTVAGLEAAPRVVGGVPAPSEIAAGVPGDLDALCRLTLNEDEGPLTPGDFATQIAPWSANQVSGMGGARPVTDSGVEKTIALPMEGLRPASRRPGGADAAGAPVGTAGAAAGAAGAAKAAGASRPTPAIEPTATLPVPSPDSPESTDSPESPEAPGSADRPAATAATAAAAAAAATSVGSALGTAGQAAGQAAGAAAQKVGIFAKAAADKAADRAAERRAQRQAAQEHAEQRRISLDDALLEGDEPIEPPLPLLPPETAEAPTRDQSKLVLVIIAGFLAVVAVLGVWGASLIGSGTHLDLGTTPRPTVTVTGSPTTVRPSGQTSSAPAPGAAPIPILSATGFDPEGDNAERNGEAPRVFDGNPSTFWSSEGYSTPNLGGLKKGVGVLLDLGQVRAVSSVQLILPTASDLTVYVGPNRSLDGAKPVGASSGKAGTITLAHPGGPVSGQYIIVWFTKISQAPGGRFRATLAEVSAR
ncbi:hypothetical protein [Nostocoides sp. HKS02]|uniref:hypothetical protein n=1 Tax=Nostocoides sp. HKS02 TaxID=1813880 RepID=UPI0012B4E4C9|nr:hypothetical protein [Tetrasphaera sp. HKS02]QGN58654.1 hypothetical protein GKE56_13085 [Tetrasphaera sp. HKS02]